MRMGVLLFDVFMTVDMPSEDRLRAVVCVGVIVMPIPMKMPVNVYHRVMSVGVLVSFELKHNERDDHEYGAADLGPKDGLIQHNPSTEQAPIWR